MQKLKFHDNTSFVEACEALLNDSEYKGGLNDDGLCVYRSPTDKKNRCIIGRAMYGRIDESSSFWKIDKTIDELIDPDCRYFCKEVADAVPFLNIEVAAMVQSHHDDKFGPEPLIKVESWNDIKRIACEFDREKHEKT